MSTLPAASTPKLLQMLNWIFRPLAYMETNVHRYGDLFRARGLYNTVFVSHPEAIRVLLTNDTNGIFTAPGETNEILRPLLGGNSLILLSGQAHRQRRQLVMPPFHGERLKVYADLIQAITREAMTGFSSPQTPFQARPLMQKITLQVILQAVFGLHQGDRYQRLQTLLAQRLDMASKPLASTLLFFPILQSDLGPWSPGGRAQALAQEIDELLYAEIRQRRQSLETDRSDVLSLLLQAKDDAGNGLSDEELRDELMTLLVAGHETTATALAWALYWSHHDPAIKARIQEEITEANATDNPLQLTKLPYLEAVCKETLRIYPVALLTFARRLEQPAELLGYSLEPGTTLMGCIYLLHHRDDLYANPKQFRPERFLERQYSAFEFMPFGAGARRCVGAALAMYELKIVLGTLLAEFELSLGSDQPVVPERRGVTLGMKGGVDMVFAGRRTPVTSALV